MISWIQDQLARNGRWIFIALLILLLIPFVFTIGNTPGFAGKERAGEGVTFYGVDLNKREVVEEWLTDAQLGATMEIGRPPMNQEMLQFFVINRIALIHLADELSIPEPGPREVKEFVPTLALFQKPDGSYDNAAYMEFIESVETDPNVTEADLERALRKAFRISKVTELLNGRGFAQAIEAQLAEQVANTGFDIQIASFAKSDFDPEIEVTDGLLKGYYDSNMGTYQISEKVESAWVRFSLEAAAEMLEIEATEEQLQAHFDENKATYLAKIPEGVSEEAFAMDDVREAVEADFIEQAKAIRSRSVVQEQASALAYDLYEAETSYESEAFNAILAKYKVTPEDLPAVDANAPSFRIGRDMPQDIVSTIHQLGAEKYFSDVVQLNNGDTGVFFFKNRIPASFPEFEKIKSRVERDYRRGEKDRLFNEKGQELSGQFNALLSDGMNFSDVIYNSAIVPSLDEYVDDFLKGAELIDLAKKEASILASFEDLKTTDRREGVVPAVTSALTGMAAGTVSPMITSGSTGYFVYVSGVDIPEVDIAAEAVSSRLEQYENRMAGTFGRAVIGGLIEAGMPQQ